MKNLLYISIILLLAGCKNNLQNNLPAQKIIITDTIATDSAPNYKTNTLTKLSKPFPLNNVLCYWKHFFTIYEYGGLEITMSLMDCQTDSTLLEYVAQPKFPEAYDYRSEHYFDTISKRHLADVNFDGFKDFTIYENGSMPMTSLTNIYVFNSETKTFELSDLSDTTIEEIDSRNKVLTTYHWDMEAGYTTKYHFGKKGKIRYEERFTEIYAEEVSDTTIPKNIHYQKIINGKVVERKNKSSKY
ncbi:hypothetical protein [uncultured Flavobacterium sp.]|uniref:XAC2610-related protein n=1 Tax=uncultured Flavobacterium sp. TaxID=165435 RepID=UPI0025E6BD65|nr:hypothetical protein [uncultured Flavobacterium sp.]